VTLHLLPIGNPWGDAFVRDVAGRPEIFVNLAIVARSYGQDNDQRWATLVPVLAHELFHTRFARQRAKSEYWRSFLASGSPLAEARLTILDEGIAHFVGHQDSIARYLVEQGEPLRLSLAKGREALTRLSDPTLGPGEAGLHRAVRQQRHPVRHVEQSRGVLGALDMARHPVQFVGGAAEHY
jgi:hypothetical protein